MNENAINYNDYFYPELFTNALEIAKEAIQYVKEQKRVRAVAVLFSSDGTYEEALQSNLLTKEQKDYLVRLRYTINSLEG